MVIRHKMGRPSLAGRGRKRVETRGFSASTIAAPVEPFSSDHRRRTILRGAGRREHPPLAIDRNKDDSDDEWSDQMEDFGKERKPRGSGGHR